VLTAEEGVHRVLPRDIDDTPLDDPDRAERPGYLMPEPDNDAEFAFKGELEDFPEDWLELDRGGSPRLRRERKAYVPEPLTVEWPAPSVPPAAKPGSSRASSALPSLQAPACRPGP
jgi:hypothetical protein